MNSSQQQGFTRQALSAQVPEMIMTAAEPSREQEGPAVRRGKWNYRSEKHDLFPVCVLLPRNSKLRQESANVRVF